MSNDTDPRDTVPHAPRHATFVDREGFGSVGEGRDIFFAAVAATRMPMAIADPRLPDVPLVFANNAFLEMTGYELDELVGKNCRFLQGPDTDRESVALIREAIRTESEVTVELINYRKDGTSFWNALFLTPVKDTDGKLVYYFSSQLDVSRRRDAEAALRQSQKLEALGQLTGGMAHDFNNLLQIILGNVQLAARIVDARFAGDATLERSLSRIRQAAEKSGALTQQLLAFARKQQLQGRVVSLNESARRTVEMTRGAIGDNNELKLDLDEDLWSARVDPTQLEAAILNLLVNSRDAMPDGGKIWIRTTNLLAAEEDVGALGLPRAGRYATIAVSDNGKGIEPEVLPRVMDPFFTTKAATEGTGLGLSMVYGFAKQSGGAASIYSELGMGTTVRLYFPALDEAPQLTESSQPETGGGRGERILVVDDRPEVAQTAADMLSAFGYQCDVATSAVQAEHLLATSDYAMLLTDLIMPGGKNGVVLAREAQRAKPHLRVLLMTGFADGSPERWGGEGYDIVFKPFAINELKKKVRRAFDKFASG
ncbi:histidine kinase famiy protein [Roseateles sp. L2-2]|uniref:histidine kinase famiy protein n=1 Tax=Roseateles sp. L2-2 TaxID=3422597 RepID=UPI003D35E588